LTNKNFLLFFLIILIPICFAQEKIEATKEGTSIDVAKDAVINVDIVDSSSLRIGNSRPDSISTYKIAVQEITQTSVTLKIGKFKNTSISLGEERNVDFDGDGIFDVAIRLSIARSAVVTLIFTSLEGKVDSLVDNAALAVNAILNGTNTKIENKTEVNQTTEMQNITEVELGLDLSLKEKTYFEFNYIVLYVLVFILILVGIFSLLRWKKII